MEKLKILQVNKLYHPATGGIEHVVRQIAEGLSSQTDMRVLVCRDKGRGICEEVHGVPVYRASSLGIAFSMPISLSFFVAFRRLRRDRDVVLIHMPFPLADIAMLLFPPKGAAVALWWHSDIIRQRRFLSLYKPFLLRLLKRADAIFVATQGHIDSSEWLPAFREKSVVIPYGVRLPDPESVAEQDRSADAPVSFLFVGRLVYYKGCDVMLRAFAEVEDATLTLIGDGPLRPALESLADQLGIRDRVHFAGHADDEITMHAFMDCDVFVLPSVERSEAFGIVQIEAMAAGKPVINTGLPGGVPCVSINGETGLTVSPSDPGAMAEAMRILRDNPSLRQRFGQAGRRRAQDVFSEKGMLRSVLAACEALRPPQ